MRVGCQDRSTQMPLRLHRPQTDDPEMSFTVAEICDGCRVKSMNCKQSVPMLFRACL